MTLARFERFPRSAYGVPADFPRIAGVRRVRPEARGWGEPCQPALVEAFQIVRPRDGMVIRMKAHRDLAPLGQVVLQGVMELGAVLEQPYELRRWTKNGIQEAGGGLGSYSCRAIRGSNEYSWHSWNVAWDLNSKSNPMSLTWQSTIPPWMVAFMASCGFYWGGWYGPPNKFDPMHFEYLFRPGSVARDLENAKAALARLMPTKEEDLAVNDEQLKAIQRRLGVDDDGVYGPITQAALEQALARATAAKALESRLTAVKAKTALHAKEVETL